MKEFTKMDWFFAGCMAICLTTYLYTCLIGKPLDNIKELIFIFGTSIGLATGGRFYSNLVGAETNKDSDKAVKLQ